MSVVSADPCPLRLNGTGNSFSFSVFPESDIFQQKQLCTDEGPWIKRHPPLTRWLGGSPEGDMAGWPRQDLVLGKKKKNWWQQDKFAALSTLVPLPKSYPYEREA